MSDGPAPPIIDLPARVDRPMGLGPFPSGRAALRFATIAAVGASVAALTGPLAWLPFLGGGFLLTCGRPDGPTLDERLGDLLRWEIRRRERRPARPTLARVDPQGTVARVANGRRVVLLAAGGVPVAFLPPSEAKALFDAYRDLLRSIESGLILHVFSEPLQDGPVRVPSEPRLPGPESEARHGYDEMVRLLCRRRRRRRVEIALWAAPDRRAGSGRLPDQVDHLVARLRTLGLEPERPRGADLARAAGRLGWSPEAVE